MSISAATVFKPGSGAYSRWLRVVAAVTAVSFLLGAFGTYRVFSQAPEHETWVLDQGTDRISIYNAAHELASSIDVSPAALRQVNPSYQSVTGVTVPHMIDFDSRGRYAFIAATAGAVTIVIDTEERKVVAALQTGAGSHMAAVTPQDDAVWVAAINARQMVKIPLDLDAENPVFAISDTVSVEKLLTEQTPYTWPSYSPICHQYSEDGSEAWITLGPGIAQGGLFVLDTRTHHVVHSYPPTQVRSNCGVAFSTDNKTVVTNWSGLFGTAAGGNDQEGTWYVSDARTKALLYAAPSQGVDAHGIRLQPNKGVYWQVNRGSSNGVVIDETTLEVVATFPAGDSPDILDFSPDGKLAYITQRGPVPRSGDPHVATGDNPGVIVVNTETFEIVAELIPERAYLPAGHARAGEIANDVHGIGVRLTSGNEVTALATPFFASADLATFNFCVIDPNHSATLVAGDTKVAGSL